MSKRHVKKQNVSVIGLFKLAGRHNKMDEPRMSEHTLASLCKKKRYIYIYIYIYINTCILGRTYFVECSIHLIEQRDKLTNNISRVSFTLFVCLFVYVSSLYVCRVVRLFVTLFFHLSQFPIRFI